MLAASIKKNDKKAKKLIWIFSVIVFFGIASLNNLRVNVAPGFDVHLFATFNAVINTTVALLLLSGLIAVRNKRYNLHKKIMITALVLSVLFLVSYVAHHLFAGETKFGDIDHDGVLSDAERSATGPVRILYLVLLITHIPVAAVILPFILFTAYRALIAEYPAHKKIARYTWPLWFYVAISGPVIYWLIKPYYH